MLGRSKLQPYMLISIAALAILFMVGYPLCYGIWISFTDMAASSFINPNFNGLQNYIYIITSKGIYTDFFRTIIWTGINVFFHVTGGLFFALLLNRKLPGKTLFRVLLMIPWAVPQYIAILAWKNMFISQYGAIDILFIRLNDTIHQWFPSVELPIISWLGDPSWTFIACIIVNIWLGIPFMITTLLGGLQSIPADIFEAAELDGIKTWAKIRHIILPLLKPVLIPVTVLGTVTTFNLINVILIMTQGAGNEETQILVTRVYNQAFTYFSYGHAAAMSVIIFLILAVFSSTFIKVMKGDKGVYD